MLPLILGALSFLGLGFGTPLNQYEYYYNGPAQAPATQIFQPAAAPWPNNNAYPSYQAPADPWPQQQQPAAYPSYYPAQAPAQDPWQGDPWWVPAGKTPAPVTTAEVTTATTATTTPTTTTTTIDPASVTKKPVIVQAFAPGFGFKNQFVPATAFLTQDANIPGGTLIPYVHDLRACWRSCVYSFNCKGFDFDHHFGSCWLHTDDTICDATVAKAHNSNYRLVHCATTTAAPGAATTIGITPAGGTNVQIKLATRFSNMHIAGGTLQAGITDENACILSCQTNNDTCQGVDFDSNGNTCWFHSATTECGAFISKTTCAHIRCGDPCATTATNMGVPNSQALGGSFINAGTTLALCITSCTGTCVAVDFDTTNGANTCWHHTQTSCNNIVTKANCFHVPIGCTAAG